MRMRWIATLVAVAVLGIAGIAVAARGGGEQKQTTGTDLTAMMCPLAPAGDATARPKPAKNAFDTAQLIGLSLADAKAKAAQHTCSIVVSLEDGVGKAVPIDVDPQRIYVYTEKGRVTEIEGVGGGI
jgi:hypothetical protein